MLWQTVSQLRGRAFPDRLKANTDTLTMWPIPSTDYTISCLPEGRPQLMPYLIAVRKHERVALPLRQLHRFAREPNVPLNPRVSGCSARRAPCERAWGQVGFESCFYCSSRRVRSLRRTHRRVEFFVRLRGINLVLRALRHPDPAAPAWRQHRSQRRHNVWRTPRRWGPMVRFATRFSARSRARGLPDDR